MAYIANLSNGQQIHLQNQGMQTIVTVSTQMSHQQQSQRSSWETGSWQMPPTLWQTSTGWVLRIEASQGQMFVQLQANGISWNATPPSLMQAVAIPLQFVEDTGMPQPSGIPITPLPPMELRMGDMEMTMTPMKMQMGNMQMQMGNTSEGSEVVERDRFCPHCGSATLATANFCAHCGERLRA